MMTQRRTENKNTTQNIHCYQEKRITRLEEKNKNVETKEQDLEETLERLNETLQQLCALNAKTQATFDTLKWVISITIMLFGAIFVFLVTELIKLIPPM
jgi:uncharacterized FlaG/YvyC family protein